MEIGFGAHTVFYLMDIRDYSGRGVKLTTNNDLAPRYGGI
jgi:hypothetical protein